MVEVLLYKKRKITPLHLVVYGIRQVLIYKYQVCSESKTRALDQIIRIILRQHH